MMGIIAGVRIVFAVSCLASSCCFVDAATTWLWLFSSTASTLDWDRLKVTFGTWPVMNFTTERAWWDITTTTLLPTTSTIPTTTNAVTTPPKQPEIIESTDTIFLIVISVACVVGFFITAVLLIMLYKTLTVKKHKKTKRLKVKALKAEQAFAPVIHPGMTSMGMAMGMAPNPAMGTMPGMMAPMDTGIMHMPMASTVEMSGYGMMDPNAMGGQDPNHVAACITDPVAMGGHVMGGDVPFVMGGVHGDMGGKMHSEGNPNAM